ncbi:MAG: diguanylate cyclase [Piscinibacter sp.]
MRASILACLLVLGIVPPGDAHAATSRADSLRAIDQRVADDPRAAISFARERLAEADSPAESFWPLLGLARAQNMLERPADAGRTLADAAAALERWPGAGPAHRAWLELVRLQTSWPLEEPRRARERMTLLQRQVATAGDAVLECERQEVDLAMLIDVGSLDEAWLAAEAAERCGRELGLRSIEATALLSMGAIAARGRARTQADADVHFERALRALGDEPARMVRSIVFWERANALRAAKRWDAAARQFEAARELSQALDDSAGIAAANIGEADVHIRLGEPARALPLLTQARRLLEGSDDGYRMLSVAEYTITALAKLGRAEVLSEIQRARRWDTPTQPAASRARLARAMAAGYASMGRYADAYAQTQRAESFQDEGRAFAGDVQMLRLEARYAAAQREAENAELRHRSETARLALEAETAKQRALWAAVATLALLSAGALAFGWRALARRRTLADLALRDELTGAPNRRAVLAYAQAQFEQSRRLGVPLTLAMIDLDHFKRVNDTLGHAGGDAVLRALAGAARSVLRGQDRLGRWGGEEWLLVMPGTAADEVPAVFQRLRSRFAATPAEGIEGAHGCTFSMGAAAFTAQTASLDELVAECDRQLYRAKQSGRDRLCFTG